MLNKYNDYVYINSFPDNDVNKSICCTFEKSKILNIEMLENVVMGTLQFTKAYESETHLVYLNEFAKNKIPKLINNRAEGSIIISFVVKSNKIIGYLFVKAYTQDEYTFPQGYKDPGESYLVCAQRELFEETGVHVPLLNIHYLKKEYGTSKLYELDIPRRTEIYYTYIDIEKLNTKYNDHEIESVIYIPKCEMYKLIKDREYNPDTNFETDTPNKKVKIEDRHIDFISCLVNC